MGKYDSTPLLPANEYGVEKGTIFLNVGVPPSETFGIAKELSTNQAWASAYFS